MCGSTVRDGTVRTDTYLCFIFGNIFFFVVDRKL